MSCGAIKEAHILKQAKQLNLDKDEDCEQLEKLEEQTALNNDYDSFWDLVKDYIGRCKAKEN